MKISSSNRGSAPTNLPPHLRKKYAAELKRDREITDMQAKAQSLRDGGDKLYEEFEKAVLASPKYAKNKKAFRQNEQKSRRFAKAFFFGKESA